MGRVEPVGMDTPPVTLSPDEQRRLYVLTELLAGRLTTSEAALTPGPSIRHVKRLKTRYRRDGLTSLAHGNRSRRPWHALDPELAARVVDLARTRYVGLNHSHLADLLAHPHFSPHPPCSPRLDAAHDSGGSRRSSACGVITGLHRAGRCPAEHGSRASCACETRHRACRQAF